MMVNVHIITTVDLVILQKKDVLHLVVVVTMKKMIIAKLVMVSNFNLLIFNIVTHILL